MNSKKRELEIDENEPTSRISIDDVDSNRDMAGAIAFQGAESALDSDLRDAWIGARRGVTLKLSAFTNIQLGRIIDDFIEKNEREPTPTELIDIMVKFKEKVGELMPKKLDDDTEAQLFSDMKTKGATPQDAWDLIFKREMPMLEEVDIIISAAIPEVLPLMPAPNEDDIYEEHQRDKTIERLRGKDDKRESE